MNPALRARGAALLLALLAPIAIAREPIPAPEDWRRESFDFPLKFAPSIGFEGREYVRFAPGWSDFASERGFSYAILWEVKHVEGPALAVHGLEFALATYFDGLMGTAAEVRKVTLEGPPTVVNFHPMRAVAGWSESYAGEIHTTNAFAKGEPLRLNVEATRRPCAGGKAHVFFAISKAPRSAAIWDDLRRARAATACPGV